MLATTLTTLTLVLRVAAPSGADEKPNPEYEAWKKFKPGTAITFESLTEQSGVKTKMLMRHELEKLSDDGLVLSTKTTLFVMDQKMEQPAQRREVKARIAVPDPAPDPKDVKTKKGKETLDVGGRKIACEWIETTVEAGGKKTVSRSWFSDEVPGRLVKTESALPGGGKSVMKLVKLEIKK